MKVLVACEESQIVTKAMRELGIEAYSCDILPCSGGHPEWHLQQDVLPLLKEHWDLIIAHPPCTYLCNSGVRHLHGNDDRWDKMRQGAEFFKAILDSPAKYIAIENPIMHKYSVEIIGRRQDQIVQPWMFGHKEKKATCFWLKNLPKLKPVTDLKEETDKLPKKEQQKIHYMSPSEDRSILRSKTYEGIGKAIAEQWGNFVKAKLA